MTSETGMETAQAPHVPYVPYEIFLLIMDAAIEGVYSAASAHRCEFDLLLLGEDESSKQLVVRAYDVRYFEFRSRFFIIRNISQTERRTRNAVHQRFVRFPWTLSKHFYRSPQISAPRIYSEMALEPIEAWVCPSLDVFHDPALAQQHHLRAALAENPHVLELSRHVRMLAYPSPGALIGAQENMLSLLRILPSVKLVTLSDSYRSHREEKDFPGRPGDLVQPDKFMDPMELDGFETACESVWKMGIRVYIRPGHAKPCTIGDLEAVSTPEGMRLKLTNHEYCCYSVRRVIAHRRTPCWRKFGGGHRRRQQE